MYGHFGRGFTSTVILDNGYQQGGWWWISANQQRQKWWWRNDVSLASSPSWWKRSGHPPTGSWCRTRSCRQQGPQTRRGCPPGPGGSLTLVCLAMFVDLPRLHWPVFSKRSLRCFWQLHLSRVLPRSAMVATCFLPPTIVAATLPSAVKPAKQPATLRRNAGSSKACHFPTPGSPPGCQPCAPLSARTPGSLYSRGRRLRFLRGCIVCQRWQGWKFSRWQKRLADWKQTPSDGALVAAFYLQSQWWTTVARQTVESNGEREGWRWPWGRGWACSRGSRSPSPTARQCLEHQHGRKSFKRPRDLFVAVKGDFKDEAKYNFRTRCCDPNESRSLMGGIVCTKCRKNYLLPHLQNTNNNKAHLLWKCFCGFEANPEKVRPESNIDFLQRNISLFAAWIYTGLHLHACRLKGAQ